MNSKAKKYILYLLLAAVFGWWIRAGYLLLYPFRPLVVHSIEILDEDNTVVAGEKLNYAVNFTKNTDEHATLRRRLVNSYILSLPDTQGWNKFGEGNVLAQAEVPDFASAGTYRLELEFTYEIGYLPTRVIKVLALSPPFRVVKAPTRFAETNAKNIEQIKKRMDAEEGKNARGISDLKKSVRKTDDKANRYDKREK